MTIRASVISRSGQPGNRPRTLTPLEGGLLGLLAREGELTGWDLAKRARTSVAYFWPIGRSQIYAALPRLETLGLVESRDEPQQGKPDRRPYRITATGVDVLRSWLGDGAAEPPRDIFGLKLFFGAHADRGAVRAQILERRSEAHRMRRELEQMSDSPDLDDFFHRLMRDLGIAVERAVAEWCDAALSELDALDHERRQP